MEGITLGVHGTYIVSAAATRRAGRRARRDRLRLGRARARDRARGAPQRAPSSRRRPCTPRSPASATRSIRPSDVHAPADYRRRLAEVVLRARRAGRCEASEGMSVSEPSDSRTISVEINGTTYEREVAARRLLVHFIRDDLDLTGTHIGCDTGNCGACTVQLDGQAVKSCMMLAVQADGATIRTVEDLAGRRRRADPAAARVHRPPRAPVRLLHAGHADERDRAARGEPEPHRARGARGAAGQHLPLHGLLEHHRGRAGRRARRCRPREQRRARSHRDRHATSGRAFRARRTAASSRGRASSSTTSSATTWATSTSCARPTRTRASSRSTSARRSRRRACSAR